MATARVKNGNIYRVQVLERALDIIDALSEDESELALSELTDRLHLHRSTVHRLLMVLEGSQYVEKSPGTRKYHLGSKLLELGTKVASRLDLPGVARPFLSRLVQETGETAHMGVLCQGEVMSIINVVSSRTLHAPATVGARTPAHSSSLGKCLLAFLPSAEVDAAIRTLPLEPYTPNTITRPNRLKSELETVRERGYAVDDEEFEEGLKCIGAPVRDYSGNVIAAISIAGPAARLGSKRMPVLTGAVVKAGLELSAALGYRGERAAAPRGTARRPLSPRS